MSGPTCVSDTPDPLHSDKFVRHVSRQDADSVIAIGPRGREPTGTVSTYSATNFVHVGFMHLFVNRLNERLPATKYDKADLGPPELVTGDWFRAMSCPGRAMKPMGTPKQMSYTGEPPDRVATPQETSEWTKGLLAWQTDQALPKKERSIPWPALRAWRDARHRELWDWVNQFFFSTFCWADVWEPLDSSTSMPLFSSEESDKRQHMEEAPERLAEVLSSRTSHTFERLFWKGCAWVIAQGERLQADPVVATDTGYGPDPGKVRMVYDFDGQYLPADKDTEVEAWIEGEVKRITSARMRRRHVNAFPKGPASWDQALMAGFENVAFKRAAFTWKHTSKNQIDAKLALFRYALVVDAKEFDSQHPRMMADRFNMWYGSATVSEMEAVSALADHCPLLLKNGKPDKLYKYTGDPLNPSTCDTFIGQISGRPTNPRFNRLSGFWLALITYEEVLRGLGKPAISLSRFLDILKGRDKSFGVLNAGDDMVVLFNDLAEKTCYEQLLANGWTPYIKLEHDPGGTFLGWHIVRGPGGRLECVPNLTSRLVKFWTPEYSFGSRHRPYAAKGFAERDRAHYDYHPACAEHQLIEEECYKEAFGGRTVSSWMRAHIPVGPLAPTAGADFQFILNPDGYHYGKFDPTDLSDEIRSKHMFRVPADLNRTRYEWCVKGTKIISSDDLTDLLIQEGAKPWLDVRYVEPALHRRSPYDR